MTFSEAYQPTRPIVQLLQQADSSKSGRFLVVYQSITWVVYVDAGSIVYASNSIEPFERLDRHLLQLSYRVTNLVAETRSQLRSHFSTQSPIPITHGTDYQAICWLVEQRLLSAVAATELIEGLIKEVLESLLLLSEGQCEFTEGRPLSPRYYRLALPPLIATCQQRIQAWQALAPHIWSPYQRPYWVGQSRSQQPDVPSDCQRLLSKLRGYSFRQLAAALNQDELTIAQTILPHVVAGTVLLRDPQGPFDQLPRIPTHPIAALSALGTSTVASHAPADERTVLQLPLSAGQPTATYTIACIDDGPTTGRDMRRYLNPNTFSIHVVSDPLKALIQVIRLKPNLIFLDIGLPGIDGYKLCRLLRNHPLFSRTPIVMLTSTTGIIDRAKAKFAGASDYLTKPFTKADLLEIVYRYFPPS
ncbi:MAG: response regulator [Cyanobacteria bacterium]|nr:response regulator [Cyanobacteriota bacterium]MDW8201789.1 response regulator [Cyanobacteriota bacterium SKYGB_h_bin112]